MNGLDVHIRAAKILIVDDNPANVSLLEAMLDEEGYDNLVTTTDPRQVAELYRQHRFDLILLDIRMPHLDGHQVMELLRPLAGDDYLTVMVLTAQTDVETRLKALAGGAKDFLTKPFDRAEVVHRIRNMLEVRMLYNERRRQNERLEQRVRERTADLERTQRDVIRRLGRAAEFRDNETGNHVLRVGRIAQRLALAAGIAETHAELIFEAAPMHDVGKIGIPDQILLKPGTLTPEERKIVETHVTIGAELLSNPDSALLEVARAICMTHHERWDGSGYPNGLAGEEIAIEGRIVALCDVFDALTMPRPYKKAWSAEEASDYIRQNAGTHFDPRLVDLFMRTLPEIVAIRDEYADPVES